MALTAIFLLDLFTPLGVAVGALYVCAILLTIRETKKVILCFAALASLVAVIKFLLFLTAETSWMVYVNRLISLIVIWATAFLAIRYRALDEKEKREAVLIEQKNKELEQFVYIASHDLKEPLRTVESIAGLLEKEYAEKFDETGKRYIHYISASVVRMRNLIKDLLDYGLIGQNALFTDIDCDTLISEILQDLAVSISKTNADVKYETLPHIKGMEGEIRMLFQNLISNSIKFKRSGVKPEISISAVKENGMWKFAIKDNGIGIDEKFKDQVFVLFQRLHEKNQYEGTGIGLAHCKKIVQLHGGTIWIEPQPDHGSIFYFTISL
jgi:light-regulated signal transduction histidine kinase (bacteriophytochrome)